MIEFSYEHFQGCKPSLVIWWSGKIFTCINLTGDDLETLVNLIKDGPTKYRTEAGRCCVGWEKSTLRRGDD